MSHTDQAELDKTLEEFRGTRKKIVEGETLASYASRARVRGFFLECLEEHSNHWYGYRYLGLNLEGDLKDKLEAFRALPHEDDPYQIEVEHLKLLRRIALQRYAFELAGEITKRLLDPKTTPPTSKVWLYKDRVLPRVPLALAVGYGVVLGSFKDWLVVLGQYPWFALGISGFSLALSWFLIYCNVRDRIGNVEEVRPRTGKVFRVCVTWSGVLLAVGWLMALGDKGLKDSFNLGVAACLGCSSLLVAIVVQFFFTKAGSIADPL